MNIKQAFILCILLFSFSCGSDRSPLVGTGTGIIRIVVTEDGYGGAAARKLPEGAKKATAAANLDNLEVRILKSDNAVLASKVFTPSDGVFNVSMAVEAADNLKVLCIGMKGGAVEHFGLNEDVDIKLGKTTIVIINGWNEPFNPEIGSIKPNPSQDGNFTLSWTQPPNASTFVLQEADNDKFSGVTTVYTGPDLLKSISGKSLGTYYYRVQAACQYNVNSKWSAASSVIVSIAQRKYTISGTVTGADDVTVTLSGDASGNALLKSGGDYLFSVNEKGNYTVTASKTGFLFTPASKTFSSVSSNQVQNFTATQITHTISGTITGADGVTVTLSGDAVGSQTVNSGNKYSFTVPEGGNYTVTPSKEGSAFSPSNGVFTNVRANIIQDFSAALNKATISGIATGADSVKITLSGDASEVQTVNDGGTYTFTVPQGKNFTVTPSKTGYVFTPASKTFSAVTVNQKQNFTASRIMRTISGTVTGASGVTVSLSGGASDSRVVSVDGGSWSFSVPDGGAYTVMAIKSGYTLSPPSRTFIGISADQTLNFTATRITHTISGTVTGADGVLVTLSGDASATQTVNSGGSYSFTVGEGGSYTVTPSKAGYVFTPTARTFTNVTTDQTLNFTAQAQVNPATDLKMVSIPGGTFQMGDEVGDLSVDCRPVHTVTLSGFQMSEAEITNAQYCAWLNAALVSGDISATSSTVTGKKGSYTGENYIYLSDTYNEFNSCWIKYSNTVFSVVSGFENWPVVSVTWSGSKAFAEYYGWDLAREAEWEYACRGGKQYLYGTDDGTISKDKAIYWNNGPTHPVNVKSYPKNPFGLYDMSGNVWEWCSDWYGSYSSSPATDPTGVQTGSYHVARGGSWFYDVLTDGVRSAYRSHIYPNGRFNEVGFRVVRRSSVTPLKYTLSGTITGADGVAVTLSGGLSGVQTVNNGGRYSFTVDSGGEFIVTPSKAGYTFTPANKVFTNVTADQTQDFTAQVVIGPDVKMVSIPAGSFQMGQSGLVEPVHSVTLSAFEMSTYEITQEQYKAVMGTNPSHFTEENNLPVEEVSWWDAIKFCNALSRKAGFIECYNEYTGAFDFSKNGFRLPTEGEWEYACRAGTTTKYYTGDSESDLARAGWGGSNSGNKTHPVGQKIPNAWGLYDMHGNVYEWCHDWYGEYTAGNQTNPTGPQSGSYRMYRGGSYGSNDYCPSAIRSLGDPGTRDLRMGFRVVRRN